MKNGTKKKSNGASHAQPPADSRERIEKRAYELWLADGCRGGNELHHWLQAEREITVRQTSQPGM